MSQKTHITQYFNRLALVFKPNDLVAYIQPLKAKTMGDALVLYASNRYTLDWLATQRETLLAIAQPCFPGIVNQLKLKLDDMRAPKKALSESELANAVGVSPKYHSAKLDGIFQDYTRQVKNAQLVKAYAQKFEEIKQKGTNLLFCGGVGTGKTYIACALINDLVQRKYFCKFERVSRLVRHVQSSYQPNSRQTEQEMFNHYLRYDLLAIDEIGLQRHTESTLLILSEIICERSDHLKPTLLISNWPAKGTKENPGVREMLGSRIYDRLLDCSSRILLFDWESYRGSKQRTLKECANG